MNHEVVVRASRRLQLANLGLLWPSVAESSWVVVVGGGKWVGYGLLWWKGGGLWLVGLTVDRGLLQYHVLGKTCLGFVN